MKKTFIAAAALSTIAGTASAEHLIYGSVDAGVEFTSNVLTDQGNDKAANKNKFNFGSGQNTGNRWGIYVKENLTGGLYGVARIEGGFNLGNGNLGNGNRIFGRQVYVGLGSNSLGEVTLGRQETSINFVAPLAIGDTLGGVAANPFDSDNLDGSYRINNSVKFTSKSFYGLKVTALYGMGGVAGKFSENQVYSVGASYGMADEQNKNGLPLKIAAAFLSADNPGKSLVDANLSGDYRKTLETLKEANTPPSFIQGMNFGLTNYLNLNSKKYQVITGGASYTFGLATLGLVYSNTQFKDLFDSKDKLGLHNGQVNLAFKVTPALKLAGGYTYTRGTDIVKSLGIENKPVFHTVSLGTIYSMSKRTNLYLVGAYQRSNIGYTQLNGADLAMKKNQMKVTAGLVYKF